MLFSKHRSIQIHILSLLIVALAGCSFSEDSTHVLLREARTFEVMGDFKKAEDTFKKIAISDVQKSSRLKLAVLLDMAGFYLRTKNYAETISICDRAIKVCEDVYGSHDRLRDTILFMLASSYEGLKDYDRSISIYNSLLRSDEQNTPVNKMRNILPLIKLGDIAFKQNNEKKALKLYHEAYALPSFPDPLYRIINYRMAIACVALGRTSEAESYFKKSLPQGSYAAGPPQLFNAYISLLKKNDKYGSAGLVFRQKEDWQVRHKEYLNWLSLRVPDSADFDASNKHTEKDFLDFLNLRKDDASE